MSRRQNDYLWGRVDGAESLMRLLEDHYRVIAGDAATLPGQDARIDAASRAALDQEQPALGEIGDVIRDLRSQVSGWTQRVRPTVVWSRADAC